MKFIFTMEFYGEAVMVLTCSQRKVWSCRDCVMCHLKLYGRFAILSTSSVMQSMGQGMCTNLVCCVLKCFGVDYH